MSDNVPKMSIDQKVCRSNRGRLRTVTLSFLLSLSCHGAAAQEGASAPTTSAIPNLPKPTVASAGPQHTPAGPATDAPGPAASGTMLNPLRNAELLDRLDDDRLPTRPRRFLKQRFIQVRQAKDEKILQLLLICVGFVGVFVAILALRSVPPGRAGT